MSAVPKIQRKLTPAEYLEIEKKSVSKNEFYNGEMIKMAGASPTHNAIKDNFTGELYLRIRGGPCRTYSSDQRVKIESFNQYAYPDIILQCSPPAFDPLDEHTLINPTAIIEILSPSTEQYDRKIKQVNYRKIPSLREILLVSQNDLMIERFARREDGSWSWDVFNNAEGDLEIACISVSIPLADIYRGIEIVPDSPYLN